MLVKTGPRKPDWVLGRVSDGHTPRIFCIILKHPIYGWMDTDGGVELEGSGYPKTKSSSDQQPPCRLVCDQPTNYLQTWRRSRFAAVLLDSNALAGLALSGINLYYHNRNISPRWYLWICSLWRAIELFRDLKITVLSWVNVAVTNI